MGTLTGRTPRDANRVPVTYGVASSDGLTVTPIEVNPITGRLLVDSLGSSNASVNLTQVSGSNITLGQKTMANSLPIVIASDQSTLSANMTQINGVATSVGNGATDTGTQRVTLSNDSTGHVEIWDGTTTANVFAPAGGTSNNSVLTAGTGYSTATLTLNSGSPNTAWFDMLMYSSYSFEILTNTTPATITAQTSGDAAQTNVRSTLFFDSQANNGTGSSTTTSTNGTFYGGKTGRYFRLSSNNGAGTTTVVLTFYSYAAPFPLIGGSVSVNSMPGSTTTGSTVPTTALYMGISDGTNLRGVLGAANALNSTGTGILPAQLIAQLDDTSPTVPTENQFANVRMSVDRSLLITVQNLYAHISTATTTTVKSGTGTLHSVTVNTLGTVASTTTIYDNTAGSGTVIGVINTLALGGTFTFDVQFTTGLTLVTTGTVAPDVTVSYK